MSTSRLQIGVKWKALCCSKAPRIRLRLHIYIFVFLGLILSASPAHTEELPFTHYTPQDVLNPLPSSNIFQTLQDSQGYLWVVVYSTGLVRYDGRQMTLYTPTNGLPDGTVTALAETPEGYLWVGGDFGLAVSDKPIGDYLPDQPLHFTTTPQGVVLTKGAIFGHNSFTVDHNGALWVGTATDGLWRYQYQHKKLNSQRFATNLFGKKKQQAAVSALTRQANGAVWATIKQSVHAYALIRIAPESAQIETITTLPTAIKTLAFQDKTLWLGATDGRLWRYQPNNRTLKQLPSPSEGAVMQLWSDPDHILWVITSTGIFQLDTQTSAIKNTISQTHGLLSDNVRHVMQDREGNLWISQDGGISKLPHDYRAFGYYTARYHSQQPPTLPATTIRAILPPDPPWPLWIGTSKGLLNAQTHTTITNDAILTICKGQHDDLWFSGRNHIYHLGSAATPTPGMQISERLPLFDQPYILELLALKTQNCLQQTLANGHNILWLSTLQHLYAHLSQPANPADPSWFSFGLQSGLPRTSQNGLALDDSGILWVGTHGHGLYRSTLKLSPQNLGKLAGKPDEVIGKHIETNVFTRSIPELNGIILDLLWHQKLLWVGTDQGLVLVDPNTATIVRRLTMNHGLQDNAVVSLAIDPTNNHVWIGTNKGLAEIDAQGAQVLRTLSRKDGLVGQETMWLQSVGVGADGTVYMGSDQGVTRYSPKFHLPNSTPPKLAFRSISFNETMDGTNSVFFHYAALSFANELENRFKTRLLGYDEDWSSITPKDERNYTNLPAYFFPKRYIFEVLAANNDGLWGESIRYQFTVQPAWWLRWWAVLLFLCLTLMTGYSLYRYKTHKQAERIIELQQLDKMKDEFLANTSHELRTPLNGIIGIVESLLDGVGGALSEVTRNNLQLVEQSGRRLANLVNDVLDISTLQKGTLLLDTQPVSLYKLADGVLIVCQSLVGDKALKLENRIAEDLPLVQGDEKRLLQVFYNLLGNAIKFTRSGMVTVTAQQVANPANFIKISIEDTGIGIPKDKLEKIFNAFAQVDASTAREFGGTGLGLNVTRQMVELHGGTITAAATLGQGSCFSFTLPIASSQTANTMTPDADVAKIQQMNVINLPQVSIAAPTATRTTTDISILVVDDELINRQVIANHLTTPSHHLLMAEDGGQALSLLHDMDVPPDLILLDVMMPKMSGYEVCTTLRKDYTASQLPVVMLTAKNQLSDLLQGFASGANDYLTKPFSKQELLARVHSHIEVAKLSRKNEKLITRLQDFNWQLEGANEQLNEEIQARHKIQMDLYIQETQMDETIAQRTEELEAANVKALQASQSKGGFLANMSHEIRTPLTAIIGFSQALQEEHAGKDERGFELAACICRNSEHLLHLINDILDFSKIEAQRLEIEQIPCDISQILDDVRLMVGGRANEKALDFGIDLATDTPTQIISDPTRIKQILVNLCNNAIKFTETGKISLSVHQNIAARMLYFDVKDTGIGMTAEQVGNLFQAFCQAETTTARRFGGTGLGLSISKQLAQMLGGTITVTSQADVGSCFHVSIHMEVASAQQHSTSPSTLVATNIEPGQQKVEGRILVAEDNPDNQTLIRMLIQKTGADLTIVGDGQQALAKVKTEDFDLLLIDIQMPVMGGEEAIKRMRHEGIDKPIYALTANAMQQDIDHYLEIGCTGHVAKPINRPKFYQVIYRHLTCVKSVEPKTIDDLKSLHGTILCAEDNICNQDMVKLLVAKTNARLTVVANGKLAIEQALAEDFDLILMDIQMPGMGGDEAIEALRAIDYVKPIVVLTANVMAHEVTEYFKLGCNDVLAKPIDRKKFYGILQTYLQHDQENIDAPIADADEWTEKDPVYQELLEKFKNRNLPKMLKTIEQALAEGDRAMVKFSAHTLKGTGANFGFFELADLAAKMQERAEEAPLAELQTLLQAMNGVVAQNTKPHLI